MSSPRPRGLDAPRATRLLAKTKDHSTVAARVDVLSALLLECPYEAHGLVGSAETPEVFTASLEGFDCVTYVETVLALARASEPGGFAEELRGIRYDAGRVEWARRNHYMTDWVRRNARTGVVRPVSAGTLATRKDRLLDAVPGFPPTRARFSCVPKPKLAAFESRLRNGDVLLFASTKAGLDVFHCGLLVRRDESWKLRHASRSAGRVVEEDLASFLRANRTAGLIAVRPLEVAASAPKGAA